MATEDILIRYRADVSQLEGDINKVIASQDELTKATQQNTQAQQKSLASAETAAKKRAQLLANEKLELIKLKKALQDAFDPKDVQKIQSAIATTEKNIASLTGEVKKGESAFEKLENSAVDSLKNIAAGFAAAFSIQSLLQFTEQSIQAFLQAEKAAEALKNAIISIGGESEKAYARLIKQSEILQATTIFGDDDIQAAQTVLSTFGLTSAQIEELLPKLTDFATVTGKDIVSAANSIGGALQGAGREFKKLGIDVNANNTELQNYQSILQGLDKFSGSAEQATKTLAGSFEQLKNDANNAQEEIGSKFAAAWLNFQKGAFGAINAILGFNKATQDKTDAANIKAINDQLDYAAELEKKYGRQVIDTKQALEERKKVLEDQLTKALFDNIQLGKIEKEREESLYGRLYGERYILAATKEQREANDEIIRATQTQLDYIQGIVDKKKEEEETNKRILTSEQLKGKSLEELNALLIAQKDNYDLVGQSNEKLIQAQIDAIKKGKEEAAKAVEEGKKIFESLINSIRQSISQLQAELAKRKIEVINPQNQAEQEKKIEDLFQLNRQLLDDEIADKIKATEADKKLTREQKDEVIKAYGELKTARTNLLEFNKQNELNLISAEQVKRIEDAAKQIDDLNIEQELVIEADKVETANAAVAKSFDDLGKAISKADFAAAKEAVTARTAALNQALTEENNINKTRIENARETELAKVKEGDAAEAERAAINLKYNNQIENADKDLNDKLAANNKELNDKITTETQRATDARIAQTFQVLEATKQLVSELTGLYDQFSEQRIAKIEEERDLALESIDAQIEQNAEYLEKRRISEEEAAANEKALLDEKVRLEAAAQKKIREEKRKQAILDKAAATFEIGLQTAIAIVAAQKESPPLNAILTAIIAATSAAQLAAVAAQPIPYRKGSKDTGRKEHLARVGEEGEELVWMPANSKVLPAKQTRKYSDIIDAMYDNKLDDYVYKNYITPALMAQKEAKENQRAKSFAENMANSIVYNQAGLTPSDLEAQRKRGQYIRNVDEIAEAIAKKLPIRDIYRA